MTNYKPLPRTVRKVKATVEQYNKQVVAILRDASDENYQVILRTMQTVQADDILSNATDSKQLNRTLRNLERLSKGKNQAEVITFRGVPMTRFARQSLLNYEQAENAARRRLNQIAKTHSHFKSTIVESERAINSHKFKISPDTLNSKFFAKNLERSLIGKVGAKNRTEILQLNVINKIEKEFPEPFAGLIKKHLEKLAPEEFYKLYLDKYAQLGFDFLYGPEKVIEKANAILNIFDLEF